MQSHTQRPRIPIDCPHEYKQQIKLLAVKLDRPINSLFFEAMEKTFGIPTPAPATSTAKPKA